MEWRIQKVHPRSMSPSTILPVRGFVGENRFQNAARACVVVILACFFLGKGGFPCLCIHVQVYRFPRIQPYRIGRAPVPRMISAHFSVQSQWCVFQRAMVFCINATVSLSTRVFPSISESMPRKLHTVWFL